MSMRELMKKKDKPSTEKSNEKSIEKDNLQKEALLRQLEGAPLDTTIKVPIVFANGDPPSPPEPKKKRKRAFDFLECEQDMLDYINALDEKQNVALIATIRRVKNHRLPTFFIQSVKLFLKYLKDRNFGVE